MIRDPRNPVTRRLTIAEIAIVIALAMVALWLVTGSMEYADRAKTMWPSFLLDFSPPLLSFRALWILMVVVGVYFALRRVGLNRIAFWAFAALILAAHVPDLWTHNRLDWHQYFGRVAYFSEPLPILGVAAFFLLALAGLVALRRVIQLGALARDMDGRGVDEAERDAVIRNEAISIGVAIIVALALASLTVAVAGAMIGRAEALADLLPWTVVTVGGGATLLLTGFLLFLYRSLSGGPPPPVEEPESAEDG